MALRLVSQGPGGGGLGSSAALVLQVLFFSRGPHVVTPLNVPCWCLSVYENFLFL